ncbi:MAG: tyrosinase family protein [Rhodobacteraceae bacterium]|nr:tyrosinase family protein [Paracoccaceae bacterium]
MTNSPDRTPFSRFLTRREVLKSAIAISAFAVTGNHLAKASDLRIRSNFASLSEDEVEMYAEAVRIMKSRDKSTKTGWRWQANIHGTYDKVEAGLAEKCWKSCPHGGYYFLPWHRMYILAVENIMRHAVGDSFTLPYWNYTNKDQTAMPTAFIKPADESNPLWMESRYRYEDPDNNVDIWVGGGDPMYWKLVDPGDAFTFQNFCATSGTDNSFGSTEGPWTHMPPEAQNFGKIERQPHNPVHNMVGGLNAETGEEGTMAIVEIAANDPVFFLHHGKDLCIIQDSF